MNAQTTKDVYIYYNGWIDPQTRKATNACGCGVKCADTNSAIVWCAAENLTYQVVGIGKEK
jgi:hypothetical protein